MRKILLACCAGMSTSLLVTRMQEAAKKRNIDVEISAMPVGEAETVLKNWDIVMLGPQVRHQLKRTEEKAEGKLPVRVIEMRDYGLMNGDNVLDAALKAMDEFYK